jgi:hypothetical protein
MSTTGRVEAEAGAAPRQGITASSLEQVQEILVGPQLRELARRLARIDAGGAAQVEDCRTEIRRRLDALEIHLRGEADAMGGRIESSRLAQLDALGSLAREMRDSIGLFEQRIQRLEEALARAQRELQRQILDQAKTFIEEVGRTRDELRSTVEREIAVTQGEVLEAEGHAGALAEADRHDHREAA